MEESALATGGRVHRAPGLAPASSCSGLPVVSAPIHPARIMFLPPQSSGCFSQRIEQYLVEGILHAVPNHHIMPLTTPLIRSSSLQDLLRRIFLFLFPVLDLPPDRETPDPPAREQGQGTGNRAPWAWQSVGGTYLGAYQSSLLQGSGQHTLLQVSCGRYLDDCKARQGSPKSRPTGQAHGPPPSR